MSSFALAALFLSASVPLRAGVSEGARAAAEASFSAMDALKSLPVLSPAPELPPAPPAPAKPGTRPRMKGPAPKASSTEKLEKLLELRVRHVRSRFKADVRARKRTIILGTGFVHGEKRDLPVQYNYDPLWVYR